MNIGFISLGCSKNLVDTEIMIASVKNAGHKIVNSLPKADLVIVNTCGFITEAKEEAINTIIDTGRLKSDGNLKYLIATGCLAQRNGTDLLDELPELDAVVGISAFLQIANVIEELELGKRLSYIYPPPGSYIEKGPRVLSTPKGTAYLKISEGCNNHCAYCAIPSIRGQLRSRKMNELIEEANKLADEGVHELTIIAQDTARYGQDLEDGSNLPALVTALCEIDALDWIRLMYVHPAHIHPDLVECFQQSPKIVPYIDIPIQHASDDMLNKMNRRHTETELVTLLDNLKKNIPNLVLRTTVMVGFPGETQDDFMRLITLLKDIEFDWLGAFCFEPEEGTPAFTMEQQVPETVKQERRDQIMRVQKGITRKKNMQRIGSREKVLISSKLSDQLYAGRAYFQAPEVDGITMVKSGKKLIPGEFVEVLLQGIREYDMIGEVCI